MNLSIESGMQMFKSKTVSCPQTQDSFCMCAIPERQHPCHCSLTISVMKFYLYGGISFFNSN